VPVIPGYNDDPEHISSLRQFLKATKTSSLRKICLLPYHKTGLSKYNRFNIPFRMRSVEQPTNERMLELKEYFGEVGVKVKIGG